MLHPHLTIRQLSDLEIRLSTRTKHSCSAPTWIKHSCSAPTRTKSPCYPFLVFIFLLLTVVSSVKAQHLRLYACALASDDPAAFMGGSSIGAGLWVSEDTAQTWQQLGWKHVKCYSVDVVDSSNGNIIYLACGNGVLRSTDAGEHWRIMTDWKITEVLDIIVDQLHPNHITIATASGIWKSHDSGEHWSATEQTEYHSHLYFDPIQKRTMILNANRMPDSTLLILTEAGALHRGDKPFIRSSPHRGALWCLGNHESKIYLGGERGLFIVDSDYIPLRISGTLHNVHSIVTVDSILVVASLSGGIWKYDLREEEPAFIRSGLDDLQLWKIRSAVIE